MAAGGEVAAKSGGWRFHKPGCNCRPCKARRWKEETVPLSAGDGGDDLVPIKELNKRIRDLEQLVIEADVEPTPVEVIHVQSRTPRARIMEWVALRASNPGITNIECAARMGMSVQYLNTCITRASREGWLVFDDPVSRIEHEIIPKVIDNLNHFLDQGDKAVTLETAKGTIFKQYQESKGVSDAPKTMLMLKIERPEDSQEIKVVSGVIVGKPRLIVEDHES